MFSLIFVPSLFICLLFLGGGVFCVLNYLKCLLDYKWLTSFWFGTFWVLSGVFLGFWQCCLCVFCKKRLVFFVLCLMFSRCCLFWFLMFGVFL